MNSIISIMFQRQYYFSNIVIMNFFVIYLFLIDFLMFQNLRLIDAMYILYLCSDQSSDWSGDFYFFLLLNRSSILGF